jgi:hypothetical protein
MLFAPSPHCSCAALALELTREYGKMFGAAALDASGDAAVQAAERQHALTFHLNHSGTYLAMRRRLKARICDVALERFSKPLGPDQAPELYSALYAYAADQMHAALNALIRGEDAEAGAKGREDEGNAEQLAAECEVTGDVARAEQLHQERCGTRHLPA